MWILGLKGLICLYTDIFSVFYSLNYDYFLCEIQDFAVH